MSTANGDRHPRIAAMVERFREIGRAQMADLPIYNHALEVEAVAFQLLGEDWIGVLITPWFMNLMLLPATKAPMDVAAIGQWREVALPSGPRQLIGGGDEVIGAYQSLSLHSPVLQFDQEAARDEATRRLARLLTPAEPEEASEPKPAVRRTTVYRRDFLRGRSRA